MLECACNIDNTVGSPIIGSIHLTVCIYGACDGFIVALKSLKSNRTCCTYVIEQHVPGTN